MTVNISIAGWTEVASFTKTRRGKLRDTFRVFTNDLSWCKCHQDKTGKDFYFDSVEELLIKIDALKCINFVSATGELPTNIVGRFDN